jgi:hypothetical protein
VRRVCLAAFLAVLSLSTAASAEVCLGDEDNDVVYFFAKLKLPKKFGATAPVEGLAVGGGAATPFPVVGAVTRVDENAWVIGFMRHGLTCSVTGILNEGLSGSLDYDCNFNETVDETVPVEPIDCSLL